MSILIQHDQEKSSRSLNQSRNNAIYEELNASSLRHHIQNKPNEYGQDTPQSGLSKKLDNADQTPVMKRNSLISWKYSYKKIQRKKRNLTPGADLPINNFLSVVLQKNRIRQFIGILKLKSQSFKQKFLQEYHNNIIDDLKSGQVDQKYAKKQLIIIPAFEPNQKEIAIWNVIYFLISLLILFQLPFSVSFKPDKSLFLSVLDGLYLFTSLVDILINMNMSYSSQGILIKNQRLIISNFIRNGFLSRITSLTLATILTNYFELKLFNKNGFHTVILTFLFIFIKGQNIRKQVISLEKYNQILYPSYYQLNDNISDIFDLIKLLLFVIVVAHIFACLWYGVADFELEHKITWMDNKMITNSDIFTKYLYSFYWATMTMTTVGYGDVIPQNDLELVTANVTMYIACAVFAFSVNSLGMILQNINSRSMLIQKNTNCLNKFLKCNHLSQSLQNRIRSYLTYVWQEEKELNDEEFSGVIGQLSNNLKEEMNYELRLKVLKNCKALTKFSDKLLKQLSISMEEMKYIPAQQIFQQNSIHDQSLYIVMKGQINLVFTKQNGQTKVLQTLKDKKSFGEFSFFTALPRTCSAVSKDFSKVFKIKRSDLLQLLNFSVSDKEIYSHLRDQIIFDRNFKVANLCCFSCGAIDHLVNKCPLIHYIPDKEKLIKQKNFPETQFRSNHQRRQYSYHYLDSLRIERSRNSQNPDDIVFNKNSQLSQIYSEGSESSNSDSESYSDITVQKSEKDTLVDLTSRSGSKFYGGSKVHFDSREKSHSVRSQKRQFKSQISDQMSKSIRGQSNPRKTLITQKSESQEKVKKGILKSNGQDFQFSSRPIQPRHNPSFISFEVAALPQQERINQRYRQSFRGHIAQSQLGHSSHSRNSVMFSSEVIRETFSILTDFEQLQEFKTYYPMYNHKIVVNRFNNFVKFHLKHLLEAFSPYSFSYKVHKSYHHKQKSQSQVRPTILIRRKQFELTANIESLNLIKSNAKIVHNDEHSQTKIVEQ